MKLWDLVVDTKSLDKMLEEIKVKPGNYSFEELVELAKQRKFSCVVGEGIDFNGRQIYDGTDPDLQRYYLAKGIASTFVGAYDSPIFKFNTGYVMSRLIEFSLDDYWLNIMPKVIGYNINNSFTPKHATEQTLPKVKDTPHKGFELVSVEAPYVDYAWVKEHINDDMPLVIEFTAPERCPPCRYVAPFYDEFAAKHYEEALIVKVHADSDDSPKIRNEYAISFMGIPTVAILYKGDVKATLTGSKTIMNDLEGALDKVVGSV